MRFLSFIFIALASLVTLTGCYTFTGASVSPDVKTITILVFPNRAPLIQPTLSQTFTDALKDKFINFNKDVFRFFHFILDLQTQ